MGTYNDQADDDISDYHAQINWGDDTTWDTDTTLVSDGTDGEEGFVEVEGSHTYTQQGTFDITVYVTGPDGQTVSDQTATTTVGPDPVTVALDATNVTAANEAEEEPYDFSLVFQDSNGLVSGSSVSNATVQVVPPDSVGIAAQQVMTAQLLSTSLSGNTDGKGDASTITGYYQITPTDDNWNDEPDGTYTVLPGLVAGDRQNPAERFRRERGDVPGGRGGHRRDRRPRSSAGAGHLRLYDHRHAAPAGSRLPVLVAHVDLQREHGDAGIHHQDGDILGVAEYLGDRLPAPGPTPGGNPLPADRGRSQ